MERTIGIDAGIAYFNKKKLLTFEKFYSHEQHKIIDWIKNNNGIKQICITGGKSKLLQQLLTGSYKIIELSLSALIAR